MSFNLHLVKKWTNMMLGKSIYHVQQGIGKFYSKDSVEGFYNDLREKVYNRGDNLEVPITVTDDGQKIHFPIEIAQYGLGAYDLYLEKKEEKYLSVAIDCAKWLRENCDECGGWKTFFYIYPKHPYSSMAQSEAACLFMRIYTQTEDPEYLELARRAIDFMLLPLEEGGCTKYDGEDVYLCEHTDPSRTVVLNGWIFSLWCLYDYIKLTSDSGIRDVYQKTLATMEKLLPSYDCGYWSYYDRSKRMTSPFYHKLHIAQLEVMYDITAAPIYREYSVKWQAYADSLIKPKRAFVVKAFQKLTEKL